jgi:DNA repair exonuclease SbcCD ATPase subunit
MNNYILNPNPGYFLHPYSILNVNPLYAVPAGSINYWNHLNQNDLFPGVKKVEEAAKKIEDNIENINQLKNGQKGNKKANNKANEALENEKNELENVEDNINQVGKRLEDAENKISDLLENPELRDKNTRTALTASLNKVKVNSVELSKVKDQVEQSLDAI